MLAIFESETDFRDFYRKEMAVCDEYPCVICSQMNPVF